MNPISVKWFDFMLQHALKHGTSFLLVIGAVIYLNAKNQQMTEELKECHAEVVRTIIEHSKEKDEVIQNNTKALHNLQLTILGAKLAQQ